MKIVKLKARSTQFCLADRIVILAVFNILQASESPAHLSYYELFKSNRLEIKDLLSSKQTLFVFFHTDSFLLHSPEAVPPRLES